MMDEEEEWCGVGDAFNFDLFPTLLSASLAGSDSEAVSHPKGGRCLSLERKMTLHERKVNLPRGMTFFSTNSNDGNRVASKHTQTLFVCVANSTLGNRRIGN